MSQDGPEKITIHTPITEFLPETPLAALVTSINAPYHTDVFIKKNLGFAPTQTENILRTNYNNAVARVHNSQFDGDATDYVSLFDVYASLYPDVETFITYIKARKYALSYIISRKADMADKRIEIHELALDEMRTILSMPTESINPNYDELKAEKAKELKEANPDDESTEANYNVPQFITDHKALALKVNIFKHLDGQKQKQIIHNQNIEVKLTLKGGGNAPRNPTLIGYGDVLPHHRLQAPKRRAVGNSVQTQEPQHNSQSPKEILDGIISEENIIDVTPKKAELMKLDESILAERLENLRKEEAKAMHIPRPVPNLSKVPAETQPSQPEETF